MCPVSPLDDRYACEIEELRDIFSEYALTKNRLLVEIEYIIELSTQGVIEEISEDKKDRIRKIYENFDQNEFAEVKRIEKETKHDVKALEYYLRRKFHENGLGELSRYIHLGLTSEDINNIAYSLMLKECLKVYLVHLKRLIERIIELGEQWKDVVMISRTHGQPAVPTTLGKEFIVFACRLCREYFKLKSLTLTGKLNGAVGNYNALKFIFPKVDWIKFSESFIRKFGLEPILITTQRNIHDPISELLRKIVSINNILLNFVTDMWMYVMLGYFRLTFDIKEVGSSTMPHKVNPIHFENAEGNLTLSNALLTSIANKMQISRLQRDLSDSTVRRNYGAAIAYSFLAMKSILRGLSRIDVDKKIIENDLLGHWEVLSEAIQVYLKMQGYEDAFEKVKSCFQGRNISREEFKKIIETLDIPTHLKRDLLKLDVRSYVGLCHTLFEIGKKWCLERLY